MKALTGAPNCALVPLVAPRIRPLCDFLFPAAPGGSDQGVVY